MDESWLQNIITSEDEKNKLKDWIKTGLNIMA